MSTSDPVPDQSSSGSEPGGPTPSRILSDEAERIKNDANDHFKRQEFQEAVELYTKVIIARFFVFEIF